MTVFAELDHDPAAAYFVSDGASRAGASERVEDEITGICRDLQDSINQSLWLRGVKCVRLSKKGMNFLLRLIVMPNFCMRPPS